VNDVERASLVFSDTAEFLAGMLRPRGLCGLEAKLFGLGLGLVASGLGLIEVGLVASKFAAYMD